MTNSPHSSPVGAGFLFSLLMSFVLFSQAIDFSYSKAKGDEEIVLKGKTPDILWLLVCAPLIGLGLGVEVDKSSIGKAIASSVKGRMGVAEEKEGE